MRCVLLFLTTDPLMKNRNKFNEAYQSDNIGSPVLWAAWLYDATFPHM